MSPVSDARAAPGDLVGRRISGRYRLVELIASGGMAQVWRADDEVLARPVAVKILHPNLAADRAFVARFRAEAVAAARLSHPSIVAIYDTCADDGVEAIVMELVRGMTLRTLLDHRHRLEPRDAITVAVEVAEALATAHRSGLVHRDVKPANVLLSEDGRVLVADFGIAKASEDADATRELNLVGTAKYLAPEQVDGRPVDYRADLYALGIVVYEMLCGRPPFVADSDPATALARLHADPVPVGIHVDDVPPELDAALARAITRQVQDRFPTAESFRDALLDAERALGAPAPPPAVSPPPPPPAVQDPAADTEHGPEPVEDDDEPLLYAPPQGPAPRRRVRAPAPLAVLVAAVVLVAIGVVALLVTGGDDDPDERVQAPSSPSASQPSSASSDTVAPVRVGGATAFDPFGDNGTENDQLAAAAVDGDPETAWETEVYGNPDITRVKEGVGLVVELDRPGRIRELVVASPSDGWTASVYADQSSPGSDLASWGEPVVQREGIAAGSIRFDLGGREAAAVLIWITHTAEDGRVAIADVSVTE
jgi:serine/threonine-protein kinase